MTGFRGFIGLIASLLFRFKQYTNLPCLRKPAVIHRPRLTCLHAIFYWRRGKALQKWQQSRAYHAFKTTEG